MFNLSKNSNVPTDAYFTEEHEWAKIENSEVKVGITNHAQEQLGDIVFVELPETGEKFSQYSKNDPGNSELGAVESIKSVSTIYAPVSGKVTEINEKLKDEPELLNEDPYGKGWICKLEIEEKEELESLMDPKEYEKFLEEDGTSED